MAMTMVVTADNHVNSTRAGSRDPKTMHHSTHLEAIRQLTHAVEVANDRNADVLILAGDLFDNGNPSAEVVMMTIEALGKLNPKIKVITLKGNHDEAGVPALHRNPIDAFIATQKWCYHSASKPEVIDVDGVKLGLVPWYSVAGQRHVDVMNDHYRGQIEDLSSELDTNMSALFGHFTVDECTFDNGMRGSEMMMVTNPWEATVPIQLLDNMPTSFWRLGHIHKRQKLGEKGGYVGSTYKVTFGEAKEQKGVEVITLEEDGSYRGEFVPFNVRELLRITLEEHEELDPHLPDLMKKGDVVRIFLPYGDEFSTSQHKVINELKTKGVVVEPRWLAKDKAESNRSLGNDIKIDSAPIDTFNSYVEKQELKGKFKDRVVENFKSLQEEAMAQ